MVIGVLIVINPQTITLTTPVVIGFASRSVGAMMAIVPNAQKPKETISTTVATSIATSVR
jgi:hypothetical protein